MNTVSSSKPGFHGFKHSSRKTRASAFWKFTPDTLPVRVSVIIPTLNEEKNLPYVLEKMPDWIDEILLVDGNSTDQTVAVARSMRPDIVVVQQRKRGKGEALRCGLEAATGDIVVLIDSDGSNDPAEMHGFVGALLSGADFAKGSRFMQGAGTADMTPLRMLGNFGFVALVRVLFGGAYTDLCYGYNAFWRDVLPVLHLDGDGFEIETILNIRALRGKLQIAEVPSFEYNRISGESRLQTFPDGWRVLKSIFREFWSEWTTKTSSRTATPRPRFIPQTGATLVNTSDPQRAQGD